MTKQSLAEFKLCRCSICLSSNQNGCMLKRSTYFYHKSKQRLSRRTLLKFNNHPNAISVSDDSCSDDSLSESSSISSSSNLDAFESSSSELSDSISSSRSSFSNYPKSSNNVESEPSSDYDWISISSESDSISSESGESWSISSDDDCTSSDSDVDQELDFDLMQKLFSSSTLPVLIAIETLLSIQSRFSLSKEAMKELFNFVGSILPQPNSMVDYNTALKIVKKLGITKVEKIDACVNDCCLYYDSTHDPKYHFSSLQKCPSCSQNRYENGNPRKVC